MTQNLTHEFRVIIIGGGAGGLELATRLARAGIKDLLLVDQHESHIWKPRLHEFAAGVNAHDERYDYSILAEQWGFSFQQGTLQDIDPGQQQLTLETVTNNNGVTLVPERQFTYQALVLALGGVTPDMGIKGVRDYAFMLDDPQDANTLFQHFSMGLLAGAVRKEPFNVAIVGSGPTGVELAGYMATYCATKAMAPRAHLSEFNVNVLEAADTFMPSMADTVRDKACQYLHKVGVGTYAGQKVSEVTPRTVKAGEEQFSAHMTVWATGRVGPPVADHIQSLATNKKRQWLVRPTLQTRDHDHVFALGDCSYCESEPAPPTAQVASEQAEYLARAIPKILAGEAVSKFVYEDKGSLLSLGGGGSLGQIRSLFSRDIILHGRLAHAAYNGLQRQHQYLIMGKVQGTLRVCRDLLGRKTPAPVKLHWGRQ